MNFRLLTAVILSLLFGASWFIYSPIHFEAFNADFALHPLMAEDLKLPEDIYIWGENRIGSIIPFVARIGVVAFGVSGMWAVSITQYLLLFWIVWLWRKRFHSPALLIAFSAFLLIPSYTFHAIVMVSHPLTIFVLFLTLNLILYERVERQINQGNYRVSDLYLWFFLVLISLWSTEQTAVPIGIMWLSLVYQSFDWKTKKIRVPKKHFYTGLLMPLPALAIWGGVLRNHFRARQRANYGKLCTPEELIDQLQIIGNRLLDVFAFNSFEPKSVLMWLMVLVAVMVLIHHLMYREQLPNTARVLLFSSIVLLLITITSKWVYVNFTGVRYFVPVIFMFSIYILYVIDHYRLKRLQIAVPIILIYGGLVGHLQIRELERTNHNEIARRDDLEGVEVQANSIFIGDYWHAYLAGALHSDKLYAFPYPWQQQRNRRQLKFIADSREVIIAKGPGLENLSDTLRFFDHEFVSHRRVEESGKLKYRRYSVLNR